MSKRDKKMQQLVATIVVTGMAYVINYLINFFLAPFITENIGAEAYGFVSLANNFASYAMIITVALNSYASRFIAVEYHKKNYKNANIYFSSVFFADLVLGGGIFLIAVIIINYLDKFLNISESLVGDVKILFLLIFFNLLISTSATVLQAAAYIKNKLDIVGMARGVSYISEAILLYTCYTFFTKNVIYVGFGAIMVTVIVAISNIYITKKYTPELKIKLKNFEIRAVKELVIEGIWNSLNSLGNTLNSGLDLVISNIMLSTLAMGQISLVKTVFSIFSGVYQLIAQPFQPLFLKEYSVGNKKGLIQNLELAMKVSGLIANLLFAIFFVLGKLYYQLWTPNQDVDLLYRLTVIATASCILEGAIYPLYYIYTLTVKNKIPCIITIIGGILNILGMIIAIKIFHFGIYSVVITTTIILLFINAVTNPIYMSKCLKINYKTFYPGLIKNVISCFFMCLVFRPIVAFMKPMTWIGLVITAGVCCITGSIFHVIIVIDNIDRKKIVNMIKSKL